MADQGKRQPVMSLGPVAGTAPEFGMDDMVCFCFGYTREAIEQDLATNGQSLIMARIAGAKKAGGCGCAVKNPRGR